MTRKKQLFIAAGILFASLAVAFVGSEGRAYAAGGTAAGAGGCSQYHARIVAIDNTQSTKLGYNPYSNPPPAYTGGSRAQVPVTVTTNSYNFPNCSSPDPLPASFTTPSCAFNTPNPPGCPEPYLIYGRFDTINNIALSVPSTVVSGGRTLTYINTTAERLGSNPIIITNTRLYPSQTQVVNNIGPAPDYNAFRLLFHYIDCSDPHPSVQALCPVSDPGPALICRTSPTSVTSVNVGQDVTFTRYYGTTTGSMSWDTTSSGASSTSGSGSSWTISFSSTGSKSVRLRQGGVDAWCGVSVTSAPAATVSCSASPASVTTGQDVTFNVSGSGWTTPNVWWTGDTGEVTPGSPHPGVHLTTRYSSAGTKLVTVWPDAPSINASCSVTVTAPPPAPSSRRLGPWDSITNLPPIL